MSIKDLTGLSDENDIITRKDNAKSQYRIYKWNILSKWLYAATPKSADSFCACAINQQILSNVRRDWLAMPLVAGFLRCLLAFRTVEKKTKV